MIRINAPASISTKPLIDQERIALIRLARINGMGPVNFARLMGLYGTAERVIDT